MTTITEILAEAFNRVKTEHGVTLSRVDFTTGYGALADIEFSATGCHLELRDVPTVLSGAPESATHYGQYGATHDCYWKFKNRELCRWDLRLGWVQYTFGESAQSIVDQITPLT